MLYLTLLGLTVSLIYCKTCLKHETNTTPRINITVYPLLYNGMIIIPYSKHSAIHCHHYIPYLCLFTGLYYYDVLPLLQGFCLGMTFQGLLYDDCFDFFCNNPYTDRLIVVDEFVECR